MAEARRAELTSLGPIKKDRKREEKAKSLRIRLTLPESNEKSCPEFNYRELVSRNRRLYERLGKKRLGDVINGPALDPTDPFASDEDAALRALAQQFENKYGGCAGGKKKKRRKENDFSTLGEGYDETDPFIDNSDFFDEVLPTNKETKHHGFYINSGELDFEEVAEESSEEEEEEEEGDSLPSEEVKKKKRLNRVESDDDEEEEEQEEEEEEEEGQSKKRKLYENGFIRPKKRKLDEGELLRKRKKMIGQFNAKNQEKKDSDHESEKMVNGCDNKGECKLESGGEMSRPLTQEEGVPQVLGDGQGNDQSIAASIEAVINKAREEAGDKKSDTQESASSGSDSSSSGSYSGSSSSSDSDSDEDDDATGEDNIGNDIEDGEDDEEQEGDSEQLSQDRPNVDNIPLPGNLPPDLTQTINRLKEEGHSCNATSQKFFTDAVNKMLLSIEIRLNKLGGRKKTQIYNHLSQHLPCGTQTIVKRAKNLLTERLENRLREPLLRLREALDAYMPGLIDQHARECQKIAESKGENGAAQGEDEEVPDAEKKKSRLPKKKFEFTEEIRKLLCDVVRVRVQFCQMMKKRAETPEDSIRTFLENEVRPLWPRGWMTARLLYKESYEAHAVITDKNYVKSGALKKTVTLGGGSVTSSASNTPQPPKPCLTATAIPKNTSSSSVSSTTKGDGVRKKISFAEQKTASESKLVEGEGEVAPVSNACISIKSVEKINKDANIRPNSPEPCSAPAVEDGRLVTSNSSEEIVAKNSSSSVNIIDISSDEDKSTVGKVPLSKSIPASQSAECKESKSAEKDASVVVTSNSSVIQKTTAITASEGKKEDNLEEEMNSVMNEILQISKQRSVDDSPEVKSKDKSDLKLNAKSVKKSETDTKETSSSPAVSKVTNKSPASLQQQANSGMQQEKKSSGHEQKLQTSSTQQHLTSRSHSPVQQQSPTSQAGLTLQPKLSAQSSISLQSKQSLQVSSQLQVKQSTPQSTTSQQAKPTQQSSQQLQTKQPVQQNSPLQQVKSSHQSSQIQVTQSIQQSSPRQQVKSLHQSSQIHVKHSIQQVKPSHQSSSLMQVKSSQQNSQQLQTKQSMQQQSSPLQQAKSSSSHQSSSIIQHSSSSQPQRSDQPLPIQQRNKLHAHSSMQQQQQSSHQPKQQSMQQLPKQQQQQAPNMQQSKSQQPVIVHQSKHQQYHTPTPVHKSPEKMKQYSQPQPAKSVNVTISSWDKSNTTLTSKTSPTSTSKSGSTWSSAQMVSPSRQRTQEPPLPVDPLANLRMMQSLSVSSVSKKTSASTSVYHNAEALATSSASSPPTVPTSVYHNAEALATSATGGGLYNSPGSKKGSGSSGNSSTSSSISSNHPPPQGRTSSTTFQASHLSPSGSQSKHSSSQSSKHGSSSSKSRADSYTGSAVQSLFNNMTPEQQMKMYKQLQSNHQANQQQQQELWQQMNAGSFMAGMGGVPNSEVFKLMSQMGNKSVNSFSSTPPSGTGQHHSQF